MKAISLHQPWASLIAAGEKTIETRRWQTNHRGPLLIVSTLKPPTLEEHGQLPRGVALCVVDVVRCRPMTQADERAACFTRYDGAQAWELANLRRVKPFAVRGRQCLYEVADALIEYEGQAGSKPEAAGSEDPASAGSRPLPAASSCGFGMIDVAPSSPKRSAVEREQGSL